MDFSNSCNHFMSRLQSILEDVLAGGKQLTQPSSFNLLREYAPDKKSELDRLEQVGIAQKECESVAKKQTHAPQPIRLTRNDLDSILHERRVTTIEEVEWLLAHANDHNVQLSEVEELELRNVAARLLASRHIQDARSSHHNEEFIAKTIGTFSTKYGDLSQAEIAKLESVRTQALKSIQDCREHKTERCACWKTTREALFNVRNDAGPGTPVSMAALAVWNSVEAFARDRPKPSTADQTEAPPGITYNWRHFKCPEYTQSQIQENTI